MKFFAIVATLIAAAAAGYADECSIVTITETVTVPGIHTPSAPGSAAPTLPPYPTSGAPYPSVPAPSGTAAPSVPAGTAAPTGTGAYTTSPPEFTGAAGSVKVAGGLVAGVAGVAALFL